MHYLSYQYVHKSQSCETWVPQSQCRCVKILSQIYCQLFSCAIPNTLPYYSFDICHYSHGDVHKHRYIGYNNDSMSFSLVEDNKVLWLCPSVASLGSLSNSDQELGMTKVDSLLVLTALLIATDRVYVAVIFYLMPAKHGQARPVILKNRTYYLIHMCRVFASRRCSVCRGMVGL